jgi:multiple sugar transport system substrate-binding protein
VQIQRDIIARYTEATGRQVEYVPVPENELGSLMVANAASGTLPDVVHHPIDFTVGWAEQGLLDLEATAATVEALGRDTFNQAALELVSQDEQPAAVPSDGWGQLLVYRRDLFEQAGLEPPDTYDRILAAAQALNDPGAQRYGITASTDPADVFTQQTFEQFALGAGCDLVDGQGNITLNSPACVRAIETYQQLISQYSPGAVQNVDSTRATYFAGQAAMVIWSPFILDELGGLRNDALPTCPECQANPRFLAENSAFVPAISAEGGQPAQYGQISYLGIGTGADVEGAQAFVEYLMGEAYTDWLSIAPEGMFPMRQGTADAPDEFVTAWRELPVGVDAKAPLGEIYGDEVIDTLIEGTEQFSRWGLDQGYGGLVTSLYSSLVVPQTLSEVLNGGLSPQAAAERLQTEATEQLEAVGAPQ